MKPLVIFLHGAMSSEKSWNYVRYAARRELKPVQHYCFTYDINSKPADDIVQELYDLVYPLALLIESGSPLVFVGHSYGGVLAVALSRMFAIELPDQEMIITTLSAPHGGSTAASLLKLFKPNSHFYKNVGSYDAFMIKYRSLPLACKTYSFVTKSESKADFLMGENDGVVTVESQERFNHDPLHASKRIDVNHFEVLLSPKVSHFIADLVCGMSLERHQFVSSPNALLARA